MQVVNSFLDKISQILTYYTHFYHQPSQSHQLSKTVRFFWPTLYCLDSTKIWLVDLILRKVIETVATRSNILRL